MRLTPAILVMLSSMALAMAAHAKPPAAQDEAAVRAMIERTYAAYTRPMPDAPDDGSYAADNDPGAAMDGYELPYTASLGDLIDRWGTLMRSADEIYQLNGFDWYCQCQDNDNNSAKLVSQHYSVTGKDRMAVKIIYSPGRVDGKDSGDPLIFLFKREGGAWKLDDMKFHDFTTLRKGLAADIKDAQRDQRRRQN
jgi:hypothetical protein